MCHRRGKNYASNGGYFIPLDPQTAFPDARVLWLPEDDTSVVVLEQLPPILRPDTEKTIDDSGSSIAPHDSEDDNNILYSLGDGGHLQLFSPDGDFDLTSQGAIVPLGPDGFDRIVAIHRLLASLHGRSIPPDTRLTRQQRRRFRNMLQAYDGRRCGATLLEIGQVLFRLGHVSRDEWQVSSHRFAVMALLRDAKALVAGGYRKLLRHRRRS